MLSSISHEVTSQEVSGARQNPTSSTFHSSEEIGDAISDKVYLRHNTYWCAGCCDLYLLSRPDHFERKKKKKQRKRTRPPRRCGRCMRLAKTISPIPTASEPSIKSSDPKPARAPSLIALPNTPSHGHLRTFHRLNLVGGKHDPFSV